MNFQHNVKNSANNTEIISTIIDESIVSIPFWLYFTAPSIVLLLVTIGLVKTFYFEFEKRWNCYLDKVKSSNDKNFIKFFNFELFNLLPFAFGISTIIFFWVLYLNVTFGYVLPNLLDKPFFLDLKLFKFNIKSDALSKFFWNNIPFLISKKLKKYSYAFEERIEIKNLLNKSLNENFILKKQIINHNRQLQQLKYFQHAYKFGIFFKICTCIALVLSTISFFRGNISSKKMLDLKNFLSFVQEKIKNFEEDINTLTVNDTNNHVDIQTVESSLNQLKKVVLDLTKIVTDDQSP